MRKAGKKSSLCPLQKQDGSLPTLSVASEKDDFNAATFKKYNPQVPTKIKFYAFFPVARIELLSDSLLLENGELNYQQLFVTITMMAFTMYCTSLWLDGKKVL